MSDLRFADEQNGFAFGPQLYATHNGSRSWHPVDVGGRVEELAISGGYVYAVVTSGVNEPSRLRRARATSDHWTTLHAAGDVSKGLAVRGTDVVLQSGRGPYIGKDVLVSHDRGAHFARHRSPVPGLPCDYQEVPGRTIWALCSTGHFVQPYRSTDGGRTFTNRQLDDQLPNGTAYAAASASTVVLGYQQLRRSTSSGKSFSAVTGMLPTDQRWCFVGFTDATHGVALLCDEHQHNRLYRTVDGGRSYHRVGIG